VVRRFSHRLEFFPLFPPSSSPLFFHQSKHFKWIPMEGMNWKCSLCSAPVDTHHYECLCAFYFRFQISGNCLNGGFIIFLNEKHNNKTVQWQTHLNRHFYISLWNQIFRHHLVSQEWGEIGEVRWNLTVCCWSVLQLLFGSSRHVQFLIAVSVL